MTLSTEDKITMRELHLEKAHVFLKDADSKFGRFVANMESLREKADYDVLFDVTQESLEKMKPLSYELVESVEQILR